MTIQLLKKNLNLFSTYSSQKTNKEQYKMVSFTDMTIANYDAFIVELKNICKKYRIKYNVTRNDNNTYDIIITTKINTILEEYVTQEIYNLISTNCT